MLPAIQLSNVTTSVSNQSGGLRGHNSLKDFDDDKGGGKDKHRTGHDLDLNPTGLAITSPLPSLPAQMPVVPALDHSQAGGLNSANLLKDVFDQDKGGGKHHQDKGGDRDHHH